MHRRRCLLGSILFVAVAGCGSLATHNQGPVATGSKAAAPAPSWRALTTENLPTARHECALVASGQQVFLLGGRGRRPVERLDLSDGTWSMRALPPFELHHFQAVADGPLIYVIGALTGGYPAEKPVEDVWIYDTSVDAWRKGPRLPEGRARGAAGLALYQGRFFLLGGLQEGHNGGFVPWLDAFDPASGRWETLPDAPRPRDHFHAVAAKGHLWAAGGRTTSAKTGHVLDLTLSEVDAFDFSRSAWRTLPGRLRTPRAGASTVVWRDHLVVIGGESGSQTPAHSEVEALDLSSSDGQWTAWPFLVRGRHGTGVAVLGSTLLTAAGSGNRGGGPELNSTEVMGN